MDHRAFDTRLVYVQEHLLLPTVDLGLEWFVAQASSTIEYFSTEMIGQEVLVNTIASMNHFATS